MASSFIPKDQEGLLLRSPLTYGFYPPKEFLYPKSIYTKDTAKTHVLGQKDQQVLLRQPEKLAFYTRNNPHPGRVCHMKGLLDIPICCVEDQATPRYLLSPPSGQDFGLSFVPKGNTRYSANVNKGIAAIGVVPVTCAWRDELERKAQDAILRAMGQQPMASRGSLDSQTGVRKEKMFDNLQDEKLLEWLCRILQTESIPVCLAWLSTASETEKTIVLNMIKMAACGELQDSSLMPSRPHTSNSQVRYIWAPKRSQISKHPPHHSHTPEGHGYEGRHFLPQKEGEECGGLSEHVEDAPFKLPDNDTIIRTAHQLSRLASRNSSRSANAVEGANRISAPKEKGQDDKVNKMIGQHLKEYANQTGKNKRQRSASMNNTNSSRRLVSSSSAGLKRGRTRSLNSGGVKDRLPPIRGPGPVNMSVTKETIKEGGSGSARLRYTSHWDA